MAKILVGNVISTKMQDTVVVEVTRRVPHPLYKKLMKKTAHFKVDAKGQEIVLGMKVRIVEVPPISKDKHFKVLEVVTQKAKEKKA